MIAHEKVPARKPDTGESVGIYTVGEEVSVCRRVSAAAVSVELLRGDSAVEVTPLRTADR
jgi:hypothetical protein